MEPDLAYQGLLASPDRPWPTWNFSSNLASEVWVFLSPRLRASLLASSSFCRAQVGHSDAKHSPCWLEESLPDMQASHCTCLKHQKTEACLSSALVAKWPEANI